MKYLAVLLAGLVPLTAPASLPNPGFEATTTTNHTAPGWRMWPIRGIAVARAVVSDQGRTGTCQQIEVVEKNDGWAQVSTPIPGGVIEGRDYEGRVWLRGDRDLHDLAICVHDARDWFPGDVMTASRNVGRDWTEVVLRFRANRTVTNAQFAVRLVQEGRLFIDDASFEPWTRGSAPTATVNEVRNGSFEAGMAGWYGHWMRPESVDDDQTPHGRRVARLPGGAPGRHLGTTLMDLPPGWPVAVSFSVRCSTPDTPFKVRLASGYTSAQTVAAEREYRAGTNWQPFTFSCEIPPSPDGAWTLQFVPRQAGFRIDGVQIASGVTNGAFAPRRPVEAGLELADTNVVAQGSSVRATLVVANHGTSTATVRAVASVRDVWEREVLRRELTLTATPGRVSTELDLTPGSRTGCFRAEVVAEEATLLAESLFTVLPRLALQGPSSLGTHVDYGPEALPAAAGARWTKTWLFNWKDLEPEPGRWTFARTNHLDRWNKAGLKPLVVLSGPPRREQDRPANAHDWGWYPPKDFAAMRAYARRTAEALRGRVGAWELQNEPNIASHRRTTNTTSAIEYALQARALAEGLHEAGVTSGIVLGSITLVDRPAKWLAAVLDAEPSLLDLCDAVSLHNYSGDPAVVQREARQLRALLDARGRKHAIWDTEWCPFESAPSFLRDARRAVALDHVSARRSAALVVQGFVARAAAGVERSFLYHAYDGGPAQGSAFGVWYDLDGVPGPVAAAHAALARELDGAVFVRERDVTGAWAFEFLRDGRPLVIAWRRDDAIGSVSMPVAPGWTATDFMGNALTTDASVLLEAEPVYLTAPTKAEVQP